jgi:glycosyltransferase involved in cell wall biosynthesis
MTKSVSVLLPVYNAELFLKEAIESIINQSYSNFEFIIINDGSTDNSENIILSFNDPRIRYIKNDTNIKLIATLNKGIALSNGEYIIRMDADDISLPNRIDEQVIFMNSHPDVGVCGTFIKVLGGDKNEKIVSFETEHDAIQFKLFFSNYMTHSSVIIRKSIIKDNVLSYKNYLHAEDYKLWVDISRVSKLHILPKVLLKYRIHENNISILEINQQAIISKQIRIEQIDELDVDYSSKEIDVYEEFLRGVTAFKLEEIETLFLFFKKLINANNSKKTFSTSLFNTFFAKTAWDLSCLHTNLGLKVYFSYLNNNFNSYLSISKKHYYTFFVKSLLKYKK